jgi:hypothetical protein
MNSPENITIWEHVMKVSHEHKAKRILIECAAASGRISMAHCFELIEKIPNLCRMLACKIALFEKHMGEETRELLKFVETAAADRGAHFKLFNDMEEARIWLKK